MGCLEKRSPALRGSNRARDIQADSAPMAALASGGDFHRGPAFFVVIGRRSNALKNPCAKAQTTNKEWPLVLLLTQKI